jgi:hypothetical protein
LQRTATAPFAVPIKAARTGIQGGDQHEVLIENFRPARYLMDALASN